MCIRDSGKTGTTNDNKDVGFVGLTPKYVTVSYTHLDGYKRQVSFTSVTVPLTVSTAPMNTGLANLHSTPWSLSLIHI